MLTTYLLTYLSAGARLYEVIQFEDSGSCDADPLQSIGVGW